jgi:hypothetical protein
MSDFLLRGRGRNIRSEEYFIEDRPDGAPGTWEIQLVSGFANLLDDLEGAIALVVELFGRSVSGNVLSFQPDLVSGAVLVAVSALPIIEFLHLFGGEAESAFGFFPYFQHFFSEFDC